MKCQGCGTDNGAARGVAGATAPGVQGPAGPRATVEVLRARQFVGIGTAVAVYVDGEEVGRIRNGQVVACTVNPGVHSVQVQDRGCPPLLWSTPLFFDAEEGSRNCFECGFEWLIRPWVRAIQQ